MRVLLQRVTRAEVRVDDRVTGRIDRGFLLLVGITHDDDEARLTWMADKLVGLRLFQDADDKMNLALADVGGAVLVVSQFTLYGDAARGVGQASSMRHAPRSRFHSTSDSLRCCARAVSGSKPASSAR